MGPSAGGLDTTKCEKIPKKLLCNRFAFLTLDCAREKISSSEFARPASDVFFCRGPVWQFGSD